MSKGKVIRGPWRKSPPKFEANRKKHERLMDELRASIEQLKEAKRGE